MNITHFLSRCKELLQGDVAVVLIIVFVGVGGFALGRLSLLEGKEDALRIVSPVQNTASVSAESPGGGPIEGGVVASRSGAKYHLPWCSGASSISDANKIWFRTPDEARAKGYTPAANCPGIK